MWNSCETCVKSLNDGAERLWVEPVRRNCHTKNRSGRRSNSFDKLNDDFVERRSGAAVGRTRSTKLSNDKRSGRGSNSFDKIVERRTPSVSEGLLQPSMNLPSGENILLHTFSYVFADKSNQRKKGKKEGKRVARCEPQRRRVPSCSTGLGRPARAAWVVARARSGRRA